MSRLVSLICLGGSAAAARDGAPRCAAQDGGQCTSPFRDGPQVVAKDQLLLQVSGPKVAKDHVVPDDLDDPHQDIEKMSKEEAVAEGKMVHKRARGTDQVVASAAAVAWPRWCGDARRRRRQGKMNQCRRRHSTRGFKDSDSSTDQWQCDEATNQMRCHAVSGPHGWPTDGPIKGEGLWCRINKPAPEWHLTNCPGDGSLSVKILTYNLFWWNLFSKYGGSDRSAGRLIARTSRDAPYDFMAFQECDDRGRIMDDARVSGLPGRYATVDGGRAIAIAYLQDRWRLLATGQADVGEDGPRQYYGNRSVAWARFQHIQEGKTVFLANHHGPLKVGESGGCAGSSTSLHIMKVIAENAYVEDAIILTGDFNARRTSTRIRELSKRLNRALSGWGPPMFGIDHVFTNCGDNVKGKILGKGDGRHKSDHDAMSAVLQI